MYHLQANISSDYRAYVSATMRAYNGLRTQKGHTAYPCASLFLRSKSSLPGMRAVTATPAQLSAMPNSNPIHGMPRCSPIRHPKYVGTSQKMMAARIIGESRVKGAVHLSLGFISVYAKTTRLRNIPVVVPLRAINRVS